MSLRIKVALLLLVLFAGFAAVELVIQRNVIYPRFLELEREEASKNVDRALQALQRKLDLLAPSVNDWGLWDDTYQYVQDRNEEYEKANLNLAAPQGLEVNVLAFYDRTGELVWSGAYELPTETELELPKLIPMRLPDDHFLVQKYSAEKPVTGIVQTQAGPFLLASRPVLTSDGEGPPMGSVLMARILDDKAIARLADQSRINMRAEPASQALLTRAESQSSGAIPHTAIEVTQEPEDTVGTTTVMDIHGNPVLTLSVATPRSITERGKDALEFATLSLGIAGGLVLVIVLAAMDRMVLKPFTRLTAHATALGESNDLSTRIGFDRKDEIGILSREFDRMVERLVDTRERLLEQSYKCGIAENASGVLHNIGNAITPVGVRLGSLKDALRQAPVDEIDLATTELAELTMDPERRADMLAFLELAAKELGALTRRTVQDLDRISTQVDHVQMILADQERFSRAERVIEPVAVAGLLDETVRLLPETLLEVLNIDIQADLKRLPSVSAARVALQQVVTNVLINASEAADPQAKRQQPVHVRVDAEEDALDGDRVLHLRFSDDGIGIAAESLPKIFERGYSTKSRASGMGLHWCANTVVALGGRIFAESDGPGCGACVHLLLPLYVAERESLEQAA